MSAATRPLGATAGEVLGILAGVDAFLDDPITVAYGVGQEMVGDVAAHALRDVAEVVCRDGFSSVDEFVDTVVARTSPRWAYFAGVLDLRSEVAP